MTYTNDCMRRAAGVLKDHDGACARLYFRLCEGCTATTLGYDNPQQLDPEMDPVWLWFDQLLGAVVSNPRNYCNLDL